MNRKINIEKKLSFKNMVLILLIVFSPISNGFTIYTFENINLFICEFGNTITINLGVLFFLTLAIFSITKRKSQSKSIKIEPFTIFYVICIFNALVFFNSKLKYSIIALFYISIYFFIYKIISKKFKITELTSCLNKAFKLVVIFQCFIGMLYVFFNISVPIITSESSSIRNGLFRMNGTFQTPGELGLWLVICLAWFFVQLIYIRDKSAIKYIILTILGIYLSGTRSIFAVTFMVIIALVLRRYRKSNFMRLIIVLGISVALIVFFKSDLYYEFFVRNSIIEMLKIRFLHWIVGFEIFKKNWAFGVGVNSIVPYINEHYYDLYSKALFKINVVGDGIFSEEFMRTAPIHNSFILLLNELGIIGLLTYISIYIKSMKNSMKIIKYIKVNKINYDTNAYYGSIFVIIAFCIFIIYAIQGWALMKQPAWIIFAILCGYSNCLIDDFKKEIK